MYTLSDGVWRTSKGFLTNSGLKDEDEEGDWLANLHKSLLFATRCPFIAEMALCESAEET